MLALLSMLMVVALNPSFVYACKFNIKVVAFNEAVKILEEQYQLQCESMACKNYFMNITCVCEGTDSISYMNRRVTRGFNPHVKLIENKDDEYVNHYVDPILVQDSWCICLENEDVYCADTVCNMAWMAILPVSMHTNNIEIIVKSNGVGETVESSRLQIYSSTVLTASKELSVSPPVKDVLIETKCYHLHKSLSGLWFVLLHDGYILTSQTEFTTSQFQQVKVGDLLQSPVCSSDSPQIIDMVVVDNVTLLATKYGVEKFSVGKSQKDVVFAQCVESFVLVEQSNRKYIIVGKDISGKKLYWTTIDQTEEFAEILNKHNDTLVQWFTKEFGAEIVDAKVLEVTNWVLSDEMIVLMNVLTSEGVTVFYLVKLKVHDFIWQMAIVSDSPYLMEGNLDHLSTSNLFDLYVWGTSIYYSNNDGKTFTKVSYNGLRILSLTTDNSGIYVFQTEMSEVYVGASGINIVKKLNIVHDSTFNRLFHFFSTNGEFYEVLMDKEQQLASLSVRRRYIDPLLEEALYLSILQENTYQFDCGYFANCTLEKRLHIPYPEIDQCFYKFFGFSPVSRAYSREKSILHGNSNLFNPNWMVPTDQFLWNNIWDTSTDIKNLVFDILDDEELPKQISLDFGECFDMNITVWIDTAELFSNHQWDLSDVLLEYYFSTIPYLKVTHDRSIDYFENLVTFKVLICDSRSKVHYSAGIRFKILPQQLPCIYEMGAYMNFMLNVKLGCPSRRYVTIDMEQSRKDGNHFCEEENCFYYEKVFKPVFLLVDDTIQESKIYEGEKNVTIIGGGRTPDNIRMFSDVEQFEYNQKRGSTLIWAHAEGVYSWLCGSLSPCGGIAPVFPETPEYYFLLQFNNSDQKTNCDYSFRFLLKLHGMPPDSIYPTMFVVMLSLVVMTAIVVGAFVVNIKHHFILQQLQICGANCRACWVSMQNCCPNRVGISESELRIKQKVYDWMERNKKHLEQGTCSSKNV